jgi:hypothetical protein
MLIQRRYAPMFSICLRSRMADLESLRTATWLLDLWLLSVIEFIHEADTLLSAGWDC